MSVTYFDMIKHWNEFIQYLDHPMFIRHVELNSWWNKTKENWKEKSQIKILEIETMDYFEFTDEEKDEIEFFKKKARENGPTSIYWWSALHDCGESSALILSSLLRLRYNKSDTELYVVSIEIDGFSSHQVICNAPLEKGMKFDLTLKDGNPVIIYDLINPVYNEYKEFLEGGKCTVISCDTLKKNNDGVRYYQEEFEELGNAI